MRAVGPIVVLINSELTDKLEVVSLPWILFRPSLLGSPCVGFRLLPEPCGPGIRNPNVSPSTRGSAAFGQTVSFAKIPGAMTLRGHALIPMVQTSELRNFDDFSGTDDWAGNGALLAEC